MFETLFGSEMPLAARFFIAFLIVLALIGLTAWLVRRFGANRLGTTARGRQPRLAVIDAATVDGRRRLVLIRRDNVEHLLMIGGPTDLVVEPNIVRAVGAREVAREPARASTPAEQPAARPSAAATIDNGWPLQPAAAGPRPGSTPALPLALQLKSLGFRRSQAHVRARLTASPDLPPNCRHASVHPIMDHPRSRAVNRRRAFRHRPSNQLQRTGRSQSCRDGAAARSCVAPRTGTGKPAARH